MKNIMNKVIAAMIMMAIANVMPAKADNYKNVNSGRRDHAVVVNNHNKDVHPGKVEKKPTHYDVHHNNAFKADVKSCTIKVSRHTPHNRVVAKVEHVHGVMGTKWNSRTRELIVHYDAHRTSSWNIKRAVA